jgi:hypothetical protein
VKNHLFALPPLLMVCWYVVAGIPLIYKRIKK